jgi:hypothetical protein
MCLLSGPPSKLSINYRTAAWLLIGAVRTVLSCVRLSQQPLTKIQDIFHVWVALQVNGSIHIFYLL